MGIGSRMKTPEEIHAELTKMSDEELIKHGNTLRGFCRPTRGHDIDKGWLNQLNEARAEWRRRHPPKKISDEVGG
jgi:hypothetical protein